MSTSSINSTPKASEVPNIGAIIRNILVDIGEGFEPENPENQDSRSISDWAVFTGYPFAGAIGHGANEINSVTAQGFLCENCISITPTGGRVNPRWLLDEPTFQVMVQGANSEGMDGSIGATTADTVVDKTTSIMRRLVGLHSRTIYTNNTTKALDDDPNTKIATLSGIKAISNVIYLGKDERQRERASVNFMAYLEPLALSTPTGKGMNYPESRKPLS